MTTSAWILDAGGFHDPEYAGHYSPEKVGWIRREHNGEYWIPVLRGIALELVRRYAPSAAVHQKHYSEQKRPYDLRVVRGRDFLTIAVLNAPELDICGPAEPVPDWKLAPLGNPAVSADEESHNADAEGPEGEGGGRGNGAGGAGEGG